MGDKREDPVGTAVNTASEEIRKQLIATEKESENPFERGVLAWVTYALGRMKGKPPENPYEYDTEEYWEWDTGYDHAATYEG